MKKKIFFLILLCAIFISCGLDVHAEEKKFYESTYINMYVKRHHSSALNLPAYHMARIYREQGTDEEVMCIEPQIGLDSNSIYTRYTPTTLTRDQQEMIKLLNYFGFKYPNHDSAKWYMVTQLMIWRTVDPNGLYYFTDKLNGNETHIYDSEINELYSLINNYLTVPNIETPKVIKKTRSIELVDKNNILSNYKTSKGKISGNKLILNNLNVGEHTITLTRTFEKTGREAAFYTSNTSQDMFIRGDINDIKIDIKIKVVNPSLKINKKDKDNKTYNNTSLENTKFLLKNDNGYLKELVINKNQTSYVDNLDFGTYTLQEIEAGTGYKKSDEIYTININEDNPNIVLDIENEVIKKEITIHKMYGEHEFYNESNIEFDIIDENNNIIDTIKTDEFGYSKIVLPYGTYKLIQKNTTEGYQKIDPYIIEVTNEDLLFIELKDLKINVPNTYSKPSIFYIILKFLLIV